MMRSAAVAITSRKVKLAGRPGGLVEGEELEGVGVGPCDRIGMGPAQPHNQDDKFEFNEELRTHSRQLHPRCVASLATLV
jgi:hypothetical protein